MIFLLLGPLRFNLLSLLIRWRVRSLALLATHAAGLRLRFNGILLRKIRCHKLLILARVKFPFAHFSRFGFLNSLLPKIPVLA